MLFFFERFQLCFIDTIDNLFDRIFQINKNNKNCVIYKTTIKNKKNIVDNVNFRKYTIQNNVFYKNNNL